jgi:hypothetical protein
MGGTPVLFACPPEDVMFAQLPCPLNDVIILFTSGATKPLVNNQNPPLLPIKFN